MFCKQVTVLRPTQYNFKLHVENILDGLHNYDEHVLTFRLLKMVPMCTWLN